MCQKDLLIDPPNPSTTPFPWEVERKCHVSFIFKTDSHIGKLESVKLKLTLDSITKSINFISGCLVNKFSMTDFVKRYTLYMLCVKSSETITVFSDSSVVMKKLTNV